jgi:hypothetical protein
MARSISFRPSLSEAAAIRRSCQELGLNKSQLIRASLSEWLGDLKEEGVVSKSPPVRR